MPALATSASAAPSIGLTVANVARSPASVNFPPIRRRVSTSFMRGFSGVEVLATPWKQLAQIEDVRIRFHGIDRWPLGGEPHRAHADRFRPLDVVHGIVSDEQGALVRHAHPA